MLTPPDDFAAHFDELADHDLEVVLNRPPNPRRRFIQVAATGIVLIVAIALIIHTALPAPSHRTTGVFGPPILITSNISDGTAILNGIKYSGHLPFRANPHNGPNTLTIIAPPFRPHTCHFSWPNIDASGNDCGSGDVADAQSVAIDFSLADLPDASQVQVNQLLTNFQAAIPSFHTTVPAGQFYAIGADQAGVVTSMLATSPLTATVTFTTDTDHIVFGGDVTPIDADVSHVWYVALPFGLTWNFTRADGANVGSFTIPFLNDLEIGLLYTATD